MILYRSYSIFSKIILVILKALNRLGVKPVSELYQRTNFSSDTFKPVWIHSASVGEVRGIFPLVKKLIDEGIESKNIIFTTTSTSGKKEVARLLPQVTRSLAPFDESSVVKKFISTFRPEILIINETEIWPVTLKISQEFNLRCILVNGRISDKTFLKYRRFKNAFKDSLKAFNAIYVQTAVDRDRFLELGARRERIEITGSTKFDFPLERSKNEFRVWWNNLPTSATQRRTITLGSIREEEEDQIILSLGNLAHGLKNEPTPLFIVAPRHPERFQIFYKKFLKTSLKPILRTDDSWPDDFDLILLNSMGELLDAYECSDISFVGGTFSDVGGHNILEPAYFSKPILCGPNTQNVREVSEQLIQNGGLIKVENEDQLTKELLRLLKDDKLRKNMAEASGKVCAKLKGATDQVYNSLKLQSLP